MGFWNDYWEAMWSNWTPIVMVVLLLVGIKTGNWMSGYFSSKAIWFLAKFAVPILLPGVVPLFSSKFK